MCGDHKYEKQVKLRVEHVTQSDTTCQCSFHKMGLIIIHKTVPEFSHFYTIQIYIIPSALNTSPHLSKS